MANDPTLRERVEIVGGVWASLSEEQRTQSTLAAQSLLQRYEAVWSEYTLHEQIAMGFLLLSTAFEQLEKREIRFHD